MSWRCQSCGCINLEGRCHQCGSPERFTAPGLGPWVFDSVSHEIVGIRRWATDSAAFRGETHGDDEFCVAHLPEDVVRWVMAAIYRKVSPLLGGAVRMHHLFARLSTEAEEATIRIHTDYGMGGAYACVLYCGDVPKRDVTADVTAGTGFFRHRTHGTHAPTDLSPTEHDRLLREDASDATAWTRLWVCPMRTNRLLVYPSSAFHGRVPAAGWGTSARDGRVVIVGFFDIESGMSR